MTRLETERLVLREPVPDDLDALAPISADPEVVRYLGGVPRTREQVRDGIEAVIRHWQRYGVGLFAVTRKKDGLVLGRVGFLVWDTAVWANGLLDEVGDPYETELGWTLAREHWGQGYAPEAAAAARDWIFGDRDDLPRLISLINVENHASIRVAEKLGSRPGRIVEGSPFTGPTCVYELER